MTPPLRRQLALLRTAASFRLLFAATAGSAIGTWMATVALTYDIKHRTDSAWWVSVLLIVRFLPSVVVGLAAGPLIDRLSRKRLIVISDIARFAVFAALPFVGSASGIVLLAGIAGVADSFFRPAVFAGVPNLVSEGDLAHGTSLLQATDWGATVLGSALGGAVVSISGPHLVYWINAVTFLFSAGLILRIAARFLQSEERITRGYWRDLGEGLAAFRRSRALATVLIAFGFAMITSGFVNVSEVFLATSTLHSGAFGFGLLWTGTGVGLVIGSLATGAILEQRDLAAVYPYVFLPWAAGVLIAAVAPNIWFAVAGMVVSGIGNGLTFPMTVLVVQRWTSDQLRGRVFTVIISAHNALLGGAMIAAGGLTEGFGARWVYGIGSALLATGSLTAFALVRGLRAEPVLAGEQAA